MNTEEFKSVVSAFHESLRLVPEDLTAVRPGPDKWSLREIVGHLVDSASNNHQRFVRLHEEKTLVFPFYDQERWIRIQQYNDFGWSRLVELWHAYNIFLLHVVEKADSSCLGNTWKINGESVTLEWLICDYYRHLKGHIEHFHERLGEIQSGGTND